MYQFFIIQLIRAYVSYRTQIPKSGEESKKTEEEIKAQEEEGK